MTENSLILIAIIATISVLGMGGVCAFTAWAASQGEKRIPALIAQTQEGTRLLKKDLHDAHCMLLAHCNASAFIQYQDALSAIQTQDSQPVPGHGPGDPSANGQGVPQVAKVVQHYNAQLSDLRKQNEELIQGGRFAGSDDGNLLPGGREL